MKLEKLGLITEILSAVAAAAVICSCSQEGGHQTSAEAPQPREIVDLGALVTEDLPERVWGKAFMAQMAFEKSNSFEVRQWKVDFPDGTVSGSNSYFTLFNHGGPHVDAPNHMELGAGLDGYDPEVFAGPLRVIDVRRFPLGRSVPIEAFSSQRIDAGDIVLIYTGYTPPATDDDVPHRIALTREAAEYLVQLPVRAFGTDAFNVDSDDNPTPIKSDLPVVRVAPNHYAFLSRGIPIYEQLFNVEKLLGRDNMYFVGPPLNIKDGDGMMVRPFVLIY